MKICFRRPCKVQQLCSTHEPALAHAQIHMHSQSKLIIIFHYTINLATVHAHDVASSIYININTVTNVVVQNHVCMQACIQFNVKSSWAVHWRCMYSCMGNIWSCSCNKLLNKFNFHWVIISSVDYYNTCSISPLLPFSSKITVMNCVSSWVLIVNRNKFPHVVVKFLWAISWSPIWSLAESRSFSCQRHQQDKGKSSKSLHCWMSCLFGIIILHENYNPNDPHCML